MNKIKIVHVLHSVGGVDVSLRQILQNINPSLFESVVIHGKGDTEDNFIDKNKHKVINYKVSIYRNISVINDFRAIQQALKIIKKEKPQIIHSHSTKGGVIARITGLITGIKVIHTPQAFSFLCTENKIKRKVFLVIERLLSKGNSLLLASSNSELQRAINEVGYPRNKTALFNNAIQPIVELNPLSISKNWPDDYICTVGRPCYQKNIEELIRVLHEVNKTQSTHLVVMGVGYHADQLVVVQNLILDLNLQNRVTLLNWTCREDVLHIISKSSLYVSTARYEGLPYAIIESLALGIPGVVSNCDGNRDLIIDNYNGYCIDNNDTKEFSKRIIELLNNKEFHAVVSSNAKDTFNKHHNIYDKIGDLEGIYKQQIK